MARQALRFTPAQLQAALQAAGVPLTWPVPQWEAKASDVYPHTAARARRLCRQYSPELVARGALVRIGRELVIVGAPYVNWLLEHGDHVKGFSIAPNQPQHAAKRFGRRRPRRRRATAA